MDNQCEVMRNPPERKGFDAMLLEIHNREEHIKEIRSEIETWKRLICVDIMENNRLVPEMLDWSKLIRIMRRYGHVCP